MMISVVLPGCASNKKDDKIGGFEGTTDSTEATAGNPNETTGGSEEPNVPPVNESKYQVLLCGYSDSVPLLVHKNEYEFADHEKYDNNEIKNYVELSVGGNTYRGNFRRSRYNWLEYFPTYVYVDSDKNTFEIDPSGMLTCVFRGESSSDGPELSKDEYLQIAKDFLSDIIDISPYEISIEYDRDSRIYDIEFKKYINGINTTDTATVTLNRNGELYMYSSFMLGKVTPDRFPDSIDLKGIEESIFQRLDQMFAEVKKYYDRIDYKEPIYQLTILKDGSAAVVCTVAIDCVEILPNNYEGHIGELLSFVIPIE
jgi:hypothetical protein